MGPFFSLCSSSWHHIDNLPFCIINLFLIKFYFFPTPLNVNSSVLLFCLNAALIVKFEGVVGIILVAFTVWCNTV